MTRPAPGQPFGPYAVEHPVGQGGFGAVYRARDTRLGRLVALKVLLPSEVSDPESVARFLREARLAAALEHPNIVRILEVGSIDETPYIAMEWIEGATLKRARIDHPTELLATIAETLAFAHEHGIVHRDLKPANVMIDREGRPKLVDFGIAKRLTGSTMATREGIVLGTPQYMAPEQELTSAVDARADQWAWGAIAYELLTGDRPTKPALAHAALDERLGAVVLRALAIAPSERYATMRDLLAAWKEAHAPAPSPPAAAPAAASRSKARLFAVTTAAVVAIGGIALAAALASRRAPAPPVVASQPPSSPSPAESIDTAIDAASDDAGAGDVVLSPPSATVEASAPSAQVKPAQPTFRALAAIYVAGSTASIDRSEVQPQLRAMRSALERCVVGQPILPKLDTDKFEIVVTFRSSGNDLEFRSDRVAIINRNGNVRPAFVWPSEATRACLTPLMKRLKVTPLYETDVAPLMIFRFDLVR